jgi:hypothetical protein
VWGRFLWHFPYPEGIQGVLDGVRRGPVRPPGPLELAALVGTEGLTGVGRMSTVERIRTDHISPKI